MSKFIQNLLLFIVATVLFIILAPIWLVYGILTRFNFSLSWFFLSLAISIDQLWNVFVQYLFDDIMIKKDWYKFGVEDETISHVLWVNQRDWTLTILWKALCCLLWKIDKDHCKKSI